MWIFLYRALAAEPDFYRLPVRNITIPGVPKLDSLSAQDCLARAMEVDPKNSYSWTTMFDILHRRDTMQAALHKVCPYPDDNSTHIKAPPSTCVISGKTYTKVDCVLMAHQLTVVSPPIDDRRHTLFEMWLIVASMAAESSSSKFTLPTGKEALPLKKDTKTSKGLFSSKTNDFSFPEAFIKSFDFRKWDCEVRLRMLKLLLEKGEELTRRWPEAIYIMYDELPRRSPCVLNCANCCLLAATCKKLSKTTSADAYMNHISKNLNACASLDPETWDGLGRMLSPKKTVTVFTSDESSQEYTRIDCFKLAIESPKRWNQAGTWLALGHELKKGETAVIHNITHTHDDCFKQARLWFDEKPSDQHKSQLTRKARVVNHAHHRGVVIGGDDSEDGSDESTEEEKAEETLSDGEEGVEEEDDEEEWEDDDEEWVDEDSGFEEEDEGEQYPNTKKTRVDQPRTTSTDVPSVLPPTSQSTPPAPSKVVKAVQDTPNKPVVETPCTPISNEEVNKSLAVTREITGPAVNAASMQINSPVDSVKDEATSLSKEKVEATPSNSTVVEVVPASEVAQLAEPASGLQHTISEDTCVVEEEKSTLAVPPQTHVDPLATTNASTTPSSSSTAPVIEAPLVRNTWAALRAVQGGLTALKALSECGGVNH